MNKVEKKRIGGLCTFFKCDGILQCVCLPECHAILVMVMLVYFRLIYNLFQYLTGKGACSVRVCVRDVFNMSISIMLCLPFRLSWICVLLSIFYSFSLALHFESQISIFLSPLNIAHPLKCVYLSVLKVSSTTTTTTNRYQY